MCLRTIRIMRSKEAKGNAEYRRIHLLSRCKRLTRNCWLPCITRQAGSSRAVAQPNPETRIRSLHRDIWKSVVQPVKANCTSARQGNCTSAREENCTPVWQPMVRHLGLHLMHFSLSAGPVYYIRCSIRAVQRTAREQLKADSKILSLYRGCWEGIYVSGCPRGQICVAK